MDVAKRLAEWRDRPPEQWFTTVNQYLPPGVTGVLVIAIAYQLATLTWTLVPGSTPALAPPSRSTGTVIAPLQTDYSVLKGLYGEAAEQTEVVIAPVLDAPDTTLSLTLRGILSREEDPTGPNGSVIIENRSEMKTYFVGQTVEGADGATLHSVYADRVLLNRNGRLETLRFPKELTASAGAPTA